MKYIKSLLKKTLPRPILQVTLRLWESVRLPFVKLKYLGGEYYCPVCQSQVRTFLSGGDPPRENARCPICHSFERHRLNWLFFQRKTDLFDQSPKRMLHVAPEPCFESRFRRLQRLDYLTADLGSPRAMVKMDITAIQYPDNTFDVIYCSHVLEHVPDDQKALSEFYRVLKPGGWAVLQVPITAEKTFEDPAITDPEGRKRAFGQEDHVRSCGPDYMDRTKLAGFDTTPFLTTDIIEEATDCFRMGVQGNRIIFFCRRNT